MRTGFMSFSGGFNYFEEKENLQEMVIRISENEYIQEGTINSWFTVFDGVVQQSGNYMSP